MALLDLDHVMMRVPALADARTAYRRLGFTVSPFRPADSLGGAAHGGGNHLVVLTPVTPGTTNLIELAWAHPEHAAPEVAEWFAGPPGLTMLLHGAGPLAALRAAWLAAGLTLSPDIEYRGQWRDPETGQTDLIHYRAFISLGREWPHRIGGAEALDFAHYLRPDWRQHPNTAQHWDMVTLTVPEADFAASLAFLGRLYGRPPEDAAEGLALYRIGRLALRIMTPAALSAHFPGLVLDGAYTALRVRVGSLAAVRLALAAGGVASRPLGNGLVVAPADACGTIIEFLPLEE